MLLIIQGIPLPDSWVAQPTARDGFEKKAHRQQLRKSDAEYKEVLSAIVSTVKADRIMIKSIERIQNHSLYRTYMARKQELDTQGGSNEQYLYHGTAKNSCEAINSDGFNRSFCGKNGKHF